MILETNKQTRDVVRTELCDIKLLSFANFTLTRAIYSMQEYLSLVPQIF